MSEQERTIFVGGISQKADENSLRLFFESFGPVTNCKIIYDRTTGKSKGYGFVTFQDLSAAEKAKASPNLFFLGKTMNVGPAQKKSQTTVQQPRPTAQVATPQTVAALPFIQQAYGYPQAMVYNPYPVSMAYQPVATTQQGVRPGTLSQGFPTQGVSSSGSGLFQTQPIYQAQPTAAYQPQLYTTPQGLTAQTTPQLQGLAASYFIPTTTAQLTQAGGYPTTTQPAAQSLQSQLQPLVTSLSSVPPSQSQPQPQSQQQPQPQPQPQQQQQQQPQVTSTSTATSTPTTTGSLQSQPSQQSGQSNNFTSAFYQPTQQQQNYASAYYASYAQYHPQAQITQSSHQ